MSNKNIFSEYKDTILDEMENKVGSKLRFPLQATRGVINSYIRGDFILVGGRKTSGKSSFMLSNYVTAPLRQKLKSIKDGTDLKIRVIYINSRKNNKATIERMVVNYISSNNKGNKVGVPSLYRYSGTHKKYSAALAKKMLTGTMSTFDRLIRGQVLNVISSRKTVMEIDSIVQGIMEEYGVFHNFDEFDFEYDEEYKNVTPILVIDDITSLIGESGGPVLKHDNAHKFAIKLKLMAKALNMVVVLGVPSAPRYSKGAFHKSSLEEVEPYHLYADRVLIMHNPMETDDKKVLGYETNKFIGRSTGICYLRMLFVASNYMGPSGVYIPYFLYPENGFIIELPKYDDEESLDVFYDLVAE